MAGRPERLPCSRAPKIVKPAGSFNAKCHAFRLQPQSLGDWLNGGQTAQMLTTNSEIGIAPLGDCGPRCYLGSN